MTINFVSTKFQQNFLQTVRDCSWIRDTAGKFEKKIHVVYIFGGSVNHGKFISVMLFDFFQTSQCPSRFVGLLFRVNAFRAEFFWHSSACVKGEVNTKSLK